MDVFMIGNGFDLHYCLPTTYTCFLRTVESISKRLGKGEQITCVAQVFGDPVLYNSDGAMKRCFDTYGASYDAALDPDAIAQIFAHADDNMWFSYLLHSFDAEKGWIDFEREIGKVIQAITDTLDAIKEDQPEPHIHIRKNDKATLHICSRFSFYYDERYRTQSAYLSQSFAYPVKEEYLCEAPYNSGKVIVDKEKIAETLYSSLRSLANMLETYLSFFVDRPVARLIKNGQFKKDAMLCHWKWRDTSVVSFNYTHTMEQLYYTSQNPINAMYYIHGELSSSERQDSGNLVLGINADKSDNLDQVDVTFLPFKKYYQRAFYRTDLPYISFLSKYTPDELHESFYNLYVIGHSLDITDHEVIRDCFSRAITIHIFYYSPSDLSAKIRNLVKIYKKKGFDELRTEKNLQFHPFEVLDKADPFPEKPFPTSLPVFVLN